MRGLVVQDISPQNTISSISDYCKQLSLLFSLFYRIGLQDNRLCVTFPLAHFRRGKPRHILCPCMGSSGPKSVHGGESSRRRRWARGGAPVKPTGIKEGRGIPVNVATARSNRRSTERLTGTHRESQNPNRRLITSHSHAGGIDHLICDLWICTALLIFATEFTTKETLWSVQWTSARWTFSAQRRKTALRPSVMPVSPWHAFH